MSWFWILLALFFLGVASLLICMYAPRDEEKPEIRFCPEYGIYCNDFRKCQKCTTNFNLRRRY